MIKLDLHNVNKKKVYLLHWQIKFLQIDRKPNADKFNFF